MAGQVAYHLMAQAGTARAPWPVTIVVSCLPVLVLGMGTALAHLLRIDAAADNPPAGEAGEPATPRLPDRPVQDRAGPAPDQARPARDQDSIGETLTAAGPAARTAMSLRRDRSTQARTVSGPRAGRQEAAQALAIARKLTAEGKPVSRRALRDSGIKGSNAALNALAGNLKAEMAQ